MTTALPSSLEIAQAATLRPIEEIAALAGLEPDEVEPYGRTKAKIDLSVLDRLAGTPNVPALYAGTPGYDLIEEIGVERIRENSLRQTDLLIRLAEAAGFGIASPREQERRGGTVTVHVDEFPAVHKELSERQILCDFRPGAGIRIGPHYYTSDAELEHVVAQITEIVETGAYERHIGAVARH